MSMAPVLPPPAGPENPVSFCAGMTARAAAIPRTQGSVTVTCDGSTPPDADVVFAALGGVLGHEGMDRVNISLPSNQLTLLSQLVGQYGSAAAEPLLWTISSTHSPALPRAPCDPLYVVCQVPMFVSFIGC